MKRIKYRYPEDIPIHFLGETHISTEEYQKVKIYFQHMCYIIFSIINSSDSSYSTYKIEYMMKHERLRIRLSDADKNIFDIFEDCLNEWVVKENGTKEELLDFITTYFVHILLSSETKYPEIKESKQG